MIDQSKLDRIWNDISNGSFAKANGECPKQVVDDKVEQVLSIPRTDGSKRDIYRRTPGGKWEEVPFVGEERQFEKRI